MHIKGLGALEKHAEEALSRDGMNAYELFSNWSHGDNIVFLNRDEVRVVGVTTDFAIKGAKELSDKLLDIRKEVVTE